MAAFDHDCEYPVDHPISPTRARELMAGDLGKVDREILKNCMAPICWPRRNGLGKLHSGTLTIAKSERRLFGITARHVLFQYLEDRETGALLRILNGFFVPRVIDQSEVLDIVTIELDDKDLLRMGEVRQPVPIFPRHRPQEGRGIMLAGYPAVDRTETPDGIGFGIFTGIGVGRRVSDKQITWVPDRQQHIPAPGIQCLPAHHNLGGISGGPLIAWYESPPAYITFYSLAGIVVEANALTECVVAVRADFIRDDGTIRDPA